MPEPKRPIKVFLCHAHADRDIVRTLYTRLTQDGVDAWLDKAKLLPGQDWELEIRKAVREADVVVVCLSKQFNQAGFRQKEVRLALDTAMEKPEGEIFIIPARLEECDNLESLRKWHWVDLFEEDGYEMLMRAFRARADRIGATLQLKKNWLPKVTPKPVETAKTLPPIEKVVEKKQEEPKPKKEFQILKIFNKTSVGVFGFILLVLITVFSLRPLIGVPEYINTPTSLRSEITDDKGVRMALVPAGDFIMGSDTGVTGEKPAHNVYLDDFYIDEFEVTNALYNTCVQEGVCDKPSNGINGDSNYANYPVANVNWFQAKTYCGWRNAGLPTEAQWEKAARGVDGGNYPWGEKIDCSKTNLGRCKSESTEVGSYLEGVSPYGVYDMVGNVWEWVADWYSEDYYQNSPSKNPLGPDSGKDRVVRGGSFYDYVERVSYRLVLDPVNFSIYSGVGFRCASNSTP
ncbi:MAG: SUMF1/EgtB/PvdO family nonheme iron enzyme [Anaerolineales bacterium]